MSNLYLKRLKFWIEFYYKKLKHYLKKRFLSFMAFSIYEVIWVACLSHSQFVYTLWESFSLGVNILTTADDRQATQATT